MYIEIENHETGEMEIVGVMLIPQDQKYDEFVAMLHNTIDSHLDNDPILEIE